jgi:hypothetical protein
MALSPAHASGAAHAQQPLATAFGPALQSMSDPRPPPGSATPSLPPPPAPGASYYGNESVIGEGLAEFLAAGRRDELFLTGQQAPARTWEGGGEGGGRRGVQEGAPPVRALSGASSVAVVCRPCQITEAWPGGVQGHSVRRARWWRG